MFIPFWTAVGIAVLFYFLVPLAGAFKVRRDWRKFRHAVSALSLEPVLKYIGLVGTRDGKVGRFRLQGLLDAHDGRKKIWVQGNGVTVTVNLEAADLFSIAAESDRSEGWGSDFIEPERLSVKKTGLLPEKTKAWVGGPLYHAGDCLEFRADETGRPLVIFYEGDETTLFPRCIRSGRHRNEYWNFLTPISLSLGFSVMAILLTGLFGKPVLPFVWIMSVLVAIIPLLPFLPPGIICTWAYRELWKKACILRSDRDFFRAPLRYFHPLSATKTVLPDGTSYERHEVQAKAGQGMIDLPAGMKFMTDSDGIAKMMKATKLTLFGVRSGDGNIVRPLDFMADFVAIPGEPERLARACAFRAKEYELLSGLTLVSGVAVNAILIWVALRRFF